MESLKITGYLANKLSVSDDWSPSIDALLIKVMLDELGLASSNPTVEDVARVQSSIDKLPIAKGNINGEWYWQCSSPQYLYEDETITPINKRWDQQERNLDWGGKRRNWSTSEGSTKAWTILLPERVTPQIDWYCVGDADEILRLLQYCTGIGKKRRTQVSRWTIEEAPDWHLWRDSKLMRPIPAHLIDAPQTNFALRNWAWRPPTHLQENVAKCLMPIGNALKVEKVYGCA